MKQSLHFSSTRTDSYLHCCSRNTSEIHFETRQGYTTLIMTMRMFIIGTLVALCFAEQVSPETNSTLSPIPSSSPSLPSNTSLHPTPTPSSAPTGNDTSIPTLAPVSLFPSSSPSISSQVPSLSPSMRPTEIPTTTFPSQSPSGAPTSPASPHASSIGKIIAKTLGWLILIALSVILFGALMSNRYRIYYALRGVWYSILRMECTRWIVSKLNFRRGASEETGGGALNEIIFDNNDLTEGLLMGDT